MQQMENQPARRGGLRARVVSEGFLGSLVGLLSVLTAIVAYQGSAIDGQTSNQQVDSIKLLTESNTEFLRANQEIILDANLYDSFVVNEGVDDFAADYYQDNFSSALAASVARDQPFDEQYYDEMFAEADATYEEALDGFDDALVLDEQGGQYQLVMLLFALGLAFAAWGSLASQEGMMRLLFAVAGSLSLLVGLVSYLLLWLG